ncbi:hypothetical protein ACIGW3_14980 [Streptomyces sp. NPDC053499]|uniref:hypothetical protein n=1 Tax=Streptomyces sp. NPDC053499 TaxID=3365707 RepID=UPI0037D91C4B
MSRETDSSSSGPKRRGGSSYPSGTEPYGTSGSGAGQGDRKAEPSAGSKPDEPKTETTLTTRIRINIPGSRPIPPVVMRTPVADDSDDGASDSTDKGTGGQEPKGTPDLGAGKRATGGGPGAAVPPPGGPAGGPAGPPSAASGPSPASGSGKGAGADDASGGEEKFTQQTSDWFAPRKPPRSTSAPSGPAAAGPGAGAGPGTGSGPGAAGGRGDLPYVSGPGPETTGTHGRPETTGTHGMPETTGTYGIPESTGTHGIPESTGTHGIPQASGSGSPFPGGAGPMDTPPDGVPHLGATPPGGPAGPTTGPATGDMPVPPTRGGGAPGSLAAPGAGQNPGGGQDVGAGPDFGAGQVPGAPAPGARSPGDQGRGASALDAFDRGHSDRDGGPGVGPGGTPPDGTPMVPATGSSPFGAGGAQSPGAPGEGRLSSDTMVSGVPQAGGPGGPGGPGDSAVPSPGSSSNAPGTGPAGSQSAPSGAKPAKPAKKGGRSKLVLAGVAVVGVLGVAYGTGLLLDHADVPKGTTVLGVEIGGLTKHEAVNKLDDELGDRTKEPFRIKTSGGRTELKPSVAGVTLDTEATVRSAAGRDYNPVSVIGSLMGGTREADPAVEVDDAKVRAALKPLIAKAEAKSPSEGMVKFTGGKPVAVKGSPHKVIDVDKAPGALKKAFIQRAVSGKNEPVELPGTVRKPKVTSAELNKAVDGFGRTAMSGWVYLKAGDVEVPYSQKTIGTFLTMRPSANGKLQPYIDTAKLKETYGSAFDNVVIQGGAGTVRMTPQHAAAAMVEALKKKAPAEPAKRVAEVPGARSR